MATVEKCLIGCSSQVFKKDLAKRGVYGASAIGLTEEMLYWKFVREREELTRRIDNETKKTLD